MEWAYEFAAGAVFIALLLRSRFVDRFREVTLTTPPRFYLGLAVYMLGPLTVYTILASRIYRVHGFEFDSGLDRVLFSPLWIALLTLLLFTGLLQLQRFEARIRQISHQVAGIPDLSQQLRNSIRSASFTMCSQVADSVRLNLLRRGIALDDIDDARHSVMHSKLVSVTALLDTIDQWAEEPGCRRFARAVEKERIRLRAVVDRIAFRITSTTRGLHDVSAVVAQYRSVKDDDSGSLWDSLDASAEKNIYSGESDLMAEVMNSTRFVYNDLIEDLRTVHEDICLLIAQGILRYEYTDSQRQGRLEKMGFAPIRMPTPSKGVLFHACLILFVGMTAVSALMNAHFGLQSEHADKESGKYFQSKNVSLDTDPKSLKALIAVHEVTGNRAAYADTVSFAVYKSISGEFGARNTEYMTEIGINPDADASSYEALMKALHPISNSNEAEGQENNPILSELVGFQFSSRTTFQILLITFVLALALGCAILPKYYFTWANESLKGRSPLLYILAIGPISGLLAFAVSYPFQSTLLDPPEGVVVSVACYALAIIAALTAICIAWLIQDRTWKNVSSSFRGRLRDGGCMVGTWVVAMAAIRLLPGWPNNEPPSLVLLLCASLIGFLIGFVVPSAFRRKRLV